MIVATIVLLHALVISLFVLSRKNTWVGDTDSSRILYLPPAVAAKKISQPQLPEFRQTLPAPFITTPPNFEVEASRTSISPALPADLEPYLTSAPDKYSSVFDPRMRKKLAESNQLVSKPKEEKYKTTYLSDGRIMVEMGNGECMVSMPKTDSRERGTIWSTSRVRCGKTDSEKFMDNVQRDLDERKAHKHQ